MRSNLPRLRDELATLISSWEYAIAIGCADDRLELRAVRRLEADLRARIAELAA